MFLAGFFYLALAANPQTVLPPGEGQAIVQQQCGGCHALKVVTSKRASKEQWSALVNQMVTRGADLEDEDIQTVIDYLAKNFGPDAPPPANAGKNTSGLIDVNSATAAELAAGLQLSMKQTNSIVSYREKNGKFKDWRDLAKVPGIEIKKIQINKDRLMF